MGDWLTLVIEVEHTGASSQFYDKFREGIFSIDTILGNADEGHADARREIANVLNVVWNNPAHRQALSNEALSVSSSSVLATVLI